MSIKFTTVKCPECGSNLPIEEGRMQVFCSYCGSSVLITNENEFVIRHIDEAELKNAEINKALELKKLELLEKKRAAFQKTKTIKIIISIVLGIIALISFSFGSIGPTGPFIAAVSLFAVLLMWGINNDDDDLNLDGKIKLPSSIIDYQKKSYTIIETELKNAGFTNIECIPLNDLTLGVLKKQNNVETITINGNEVVAWGTKHSPDAKIVISYHSFSRR